MATVSHVAGSERTNTNNQNFYASNSVTPTGNALLLVFAMITASEDPAPTCTESANGMTFTLVASQAKPTNVGDKVYCFVSDQLTPASPVAMTATVSLPTDPGTGGIVSIEQVTGMTLTGLSAIKQFDVTNGGAGTTPDVVFASAVDTNNPTVIGHIDTSGAGTTEPTGWTEAYDTTFATPTTGGSVVYRNSGFSGTTITWGSTSTQHAQVGIELDSSSGSVTGTLASTLDGVTMAASGTETITGTLASTLAGATIAATGAETFTGTLASALDGATISATGAETMSGTWASTLDAVTLAASGTVVLPGIDGTITITLDGVTMSASGDVGVVNWFRTPTVRRRAGDRRLYDLYTLNKGISVVKVDGHYRRYPIPPHTLLTPLVAGRDYFIGGTAAVVVTSEVAAQLEADGFTVYDHNPDEDL